MGAKYNLRECFIIVWDYDATLILDFDEVRVTDEDLKYILTEDESDELDELIYQAIDEQGAINQNGRYYISGELAKLIREITGRKTFNMLVPILEELKERCNLVYRFIEAIAREVDREELVRLAKEASEIERKYGGVTFDLFKAISAEKDKPTLGDIVRYKGTEGEVIGEGIRKDSITIKDDEGKQIKVEGEDLGKIEIVKKIVNI